MKNGSRLHVPHGERGVVLVAAVLIVLLMTVLAATFMATTNGERRMSSNVQTAKGSLYAADAGVRTEQQLLANVARTKLDSLLALWNGNGPIITAPTTLFPLGTIAINSTNPRFSATGSIAWQDSDLTDTAQVYDYVYNITATGNSGFLGSRRVQSSGILRVSADRGTFTDYLMFTSQHTLPSGGGVWFTSSTNFDGRVHTDGEFRFAFKPSFQDLVSSVNTNAWYYNNASPIELAANNNGTLDKPNFFGGFTRGAAPISLPTDAFSQQDAALGLAAGSASSPSNSVINTQLGTGAGSSTPPNGIYVVNSGGVVSGGIYIQGSLDQLKMSLDASGHQVYTLKQGSTTKTVTVDRVGNHTTIVTGSSTTTYYGVPRGVMYCNGSINSMGGPDRVSGLPVPAVADSNQSLVTATGDIVLTSDLTYHDYNAGNSVLGLFSMNGNVRIGNSAPNDMNVDSFVLAASTTGIFSVDNYDSGSPRGIFHLRGGMVSQYYGAFGTFNSDGTQRSGFGRDFHYDRRGIDPPYYPLTGRFTSNEPAARTLAWKEL